MAKKAAKKVETKKPVMTVGHSIGILRTACGRLEGREHGTSDTPFDHDDLLCLIGELWDEREEALDL